MIFRKLFAKNNTTPQEPATPPKAPYSSAEEVSRLFVSTLLDKDDHNSIGNSNEVDQALIKAVMAEIDNFDSSSIPRIADASMALLEKLLDETVSSAEVVAVIKEDPALLGKLLQMANSPFYRSRHIDIESVEDAVVVLGNDGVRKLVITTLMSNQLKISTVYFKYFGANIWQHSHEVATMAASYAALQGINEFRAYLNGLIHDVGKLIIFKLLIKVLEQSPPDAYPSKSFFSNIIDRYSHQLTLCALKAWELDPAWVKPILTYRSNVPADKMDIDSRALYISNHCSELHRLNHLKLLDDEELSRQLYSKGVESSTYTTLTKTI